ncbi:hypothetical protein ACFRI7_01090 [Streptomyces sp. NPDC056716]|uniref:hypothetical protein n=1 Tax=unclassified Streptomyces TaxID=2593676 RepID=UPI003683D8CC
MAENETPADRPETAHIPEPGTVVVDTSRDRIGEFRGVVGPYWSLRPILGGTEWDADPARVRPASPAERLSAENARVNARSRRALL